MESLLLITKKHEYFFVKDTSKDYHCTYGFFRADVLQNAKPGDELVFSKITHKCTVVEPTLADRFARMKRLAQIITPKDAGAILSTTMVNKDSICVDAGAGSGSLACFLAQYVKHVYSYDIREDHLEMAATNVAEFAPDNVTLKLHNVHESIPHENVDLITLDMPEPWHALKHAQDALKFGSYVVCYVPCANQMQEVAREIEESCDRLRVEKAVEIIERTWKATPKAVRPQTQQGVQHTAFLMFIRKV